MKITKVQAREIYDSRGVPTIESEIFLEDGTSYCASVPVGIYQGPFEAFALRDGGKRFDGMGVQKAVEAVEAYIAPLILNEVPDVVRLDQKILQADGTAQKKNFGANSILSISAAMLKAQAHVMDLDVYGIIAQLCDAQTAMLPFPHLAIFNGGAHALNGISFQECMIIPTQAKNFKEAIGQGVEVFGLLRAACKEKKLLPIIGDEGALAPLFKSSKQALDFLMEVLAKHKKDKSYKLAINVSANQLYDKKEGSYTIDGKSYTPAQLNKYYQKLFNEYPICSIQDPFACQDYEHWIEFTAAVGDKIQVVGNDIFATDPQRIYEGIEKKMATAAAINPSQIGSVTETLQAVQVCQEHGWAVVVSDRIGETDDYLIADLAVGTSVGQIKAGGCTRGERLSKYNRLIAIEDQLALSLLEE